MKGYRKYFKDHLRRNYPDKFPALVARVEAHYQLISRDTTFSFRSPNPIDRRLDFSAYFLALIKTLVQEAESYDRIREICLAIVTDFVRPKNRFQAWLKTLPPKLIGTWLAGMLIKVFHRKVSRNPHAEGFVANIITDKSETYGLGYGFDILECGICKLFSKHDCGQYASILCEVDKITSAMAGLILIRRGTIANGFSHCDFRFKKA
jgi:hypothetical protein